MKLIEVTCLHTLAMYANKPRTLQNKSYMNFWAEGHVSAADVFLYGPVRAHMVAKCCWWMCHRSVLLGSLSGQRSSEVLNSKTLRDLKPMKVCHLEKCILCWYGFLIFNEGSWDLSGHCMIHLSDMKARDFIT